MKQIQKLGPLEGLLKMIPGVNSKMIKQANTDPRRMRHVEAIVLSMTPKERRMPHVIDGSRRQRIAKGAGVTIQQVNQLLAARKQMEKMMKQIGKGKFPALPAVPPKAGRR